MCDGLCLLLFFFQITTKKQNILHLKKRKWKNRCLKPFSEQSAMFSSNELCCFSSSWYQALLVGHVFTKRWPIDQMWTNAASKIRRHAHIDTDIRLHLDTHWQWGRKKTSACGLKPLIPASFMPIWPLCLPRCPKQNTQTGCWWY